MAMNTQHKMGMNGVVKSGGEETMEVFSEEHASEGLANRYFLIK